VTRSASSSKSRDVPRSLLSAVLRLAAPAIAAQLLQTGVIYADRIMLGHAKVGDGALAGLQVAGPIEWTLVSVGSAFAVGTLALVGRAVGAGDRDAARRHATLAITAALGIGLALTLAAAWVVLPLLPRLFPHADAGPGGALTLGAAYLRAAMLAAPFYCVGAAGFAVLSGAGDTMTPLRIGVAVNVLHVGLNWLLIDGHAGAPALGAAGAGYSTAASYALESLLAVAALARADRAASIRPWRWPWREASARRDVGDLVSLSSAATAERVVYHTGYLAFVWMIARLGDDAMAGNQALIAIEAISYTTVEGFALAGSAMVAQSLGAGDAREARAVGWLSTAAGAVALSSFGLAFLALRDVLPAMVTERASVRAAASASIVVMAIAQPFMAAGVILGQSLRGAGEVRRALAVSVIAGFGVRLGVTGFATFGGAYGLSLGLRGVWLGSLADWIVRTAMLVPLWRWSALRAGRTLDERGGEAQPLEA
jgi:MATE family multidrug resistance protein